MTELGPSVRKWRCELHDRLAFCFVVGEGCLVAAVVVVVVLETGSPYVVLDDLELMEIHLPASASWVQGLIFTHQASDYPFIIGVGVIFTSVSINLFPFFFFHQTLIKSLYPLSKFFFFLFQWVFVSSLGITLGRVTVTIGPDTQWRKRSGPYLACRQVYAVVGARIHRAKQWVEWGFPVPWTSYSVSDRWQ